MHTNSRLILALGITLGLLGAACGGSSETADTPADPPDNSETASSSPESTPPTTDASAEPSPATEAPATEAPATEAPATDAPVETTSATTTIAPLEPEDFDLATIPDLVTDIDEAVGDPSVDPLAIAQGLFGFPFDIPVPSGSSLLSATAGLNFGTDEANPFNFAYRAIADGGVVPDVDISLDDNGPGSLAIIDFYDPILAELGYERANSTASDPGDPGGPNSVNHVYVTEQEQRDFNGVLGIVQPVFVWAEEDTNGWAYDDTLDQLGGWYVDVEGEFPVDAEATPIPVINAIIEQIELPDDLTLADVSLSLRTRSADSFSIDLGETYTDIYVEWEAPAASFETIVELFGDTTTLFGSDSAFVAGEDDFFNDGAFIATELTDFGETTKRLDILLLQRYGGIIDIDESPDGVEPMTVSIDLELNPVAPQLALFTE